MDRYRWLTSMIQLSKVYGASPVNNQIILFDGHDSHFDNRSLIHVERRNMQPFILKPGDSANNHPNDNGKNSKHKSHYNEVKSAWIMKYVTRKFLPHYMNSILVESCDTFQVSDRKSIRDCFLKTKLLPLVHLYLTTNTQACAASIQVSSGVKAEEINKISCHTVAHIEVQETSTNVPMVVLRANGSQKLSSNIVLWTSVHDAVSKITVIPIQ